MRHVVLGRVDLTGVGYDRGSPDAPIVIVNFSDFGCPYCAEFALETEPVLEREYIATGKVFFKYVPFVVGIFPNARQAVRASECAADQQKFWPLYQRLYENQRQWKGALAPYPLLQELAVAAGLDGREFNRCYTSNEVHPRTRIANSDADRLHVRVTPSFFINGQLVEGALPLEQFRQVINTALESAGKTRP